MSDARGNDRSVAFAAAPRLHGRATSAIGRGFAGRARVLGRAAPTVGPGAEPSTRSRRGDQDSRISAMRPSLFGAGAIAAARKELQDARKQDERRDDHRDGRDSGRASRSTSAASHGQRIRHRRDLHPDRKKEKQIQVLVSHSISERRCRGPRGDPRGLHRGISPAGLRPGSQARSRRDRRSARGRPASRRAAQGRSDRRLARPGPLDRFAGGRQPAVLVVCATRFDSRSPARGP